MEGIEPTNSPTNSLSKVHRNRTCWHSETAIRRLAIMFIVPCVALGIQNADYSQTIERLQANSIIWPLRQARIRTLHYRLQKRCGCWLRMIARLPLGNTLTDRFLYLQYPFCHCLTIWGELYLWQLRHRGIGTRTFKSDCYMDCSSVNYGTIIIHHHIGLHQIPLSAVNATGRSRTALNRIVLVGKGGVMKNTKKKILYGMNR